MPYLPIPNGGTRLREAAGIRRNICPLVVSMLRNSRKHAYLFSRRTASARAQRLQACILGGFLGKLYVYWWKQKINLMVDPIP